MAHIDSKNTLLVFVTELKTSRYGFVVATCSAIVSGNYLDYVVQNGKLDFTSSSKAKKGKILVVYCVNGFQSLHEKFSTPTMHSL